MNWRVAITILVLLLFVGLFNYYIYNLVRTEISYPHCKLILWYNIAGALIFYFFNDTYYCCDINDQFNKILFWSVIGDILIIILTYHNLITNTYYLFLFFNGLVFAITCMVLISGIRHGIFNND